MEDYIKITEYLDNGAESRVAKHRKSPIMGIIILICGLAVLLLSLKVKLPDALTMSLLTIGAIAALVGLFMAIMTAVSDNACYLFLPTKSKIKRYRRYINSDDRQLLRDILNDNTFQLLGNVRKECSTGTLLQFYLSADGAYAVAQLEEYIPHDFVAATPPVVINPDDIPYVEQWLKK